ncbi:MAG TPA: sulfotransferase [Rhizomicrobium sp.]|jgi:tetratricopeptide (TPR) repeat protein
MTAASLRQTADLRIGDPYESAKEKLFPRVRDRVLAEAAAALETEQPALAEQLIARHLKKKPRDAEALNLMADIARRAKRFEDSERLLSQCVVLAPERAGYRYNYAIVLRLLHKYEEALAALDTLVERDPDNPLFLDQRAMVLSWLGRHDESLAQRHTLVEAYPESADAWLRYARALRDTGFQDECLAAIRKALALAPTLAGCYSILAALKVYRFTQAETERMEELIADKRLAPDDRTALHQALGKAYGDAESYAKSFENYAKANAQRRLRTSFDGGSPSAHRAACERFFDADFFRKRTGWGCDSRAPIFVVGLARSGSTLLEQILSSHSAIEGLGERADLDIALLQPLLNLRDEIQLDRITNGNAVEKSGLVDAYIRIMERLGPDRFRLAGEHYLDLVARNRVLGRPFFVDKTLRNFFYIGLIQLILPKAKIVDARRHPLDCGWSCFKSQFPGSNFTFRLADIGQDYANYVRLMDHFDRVLPGRVHRVIYEHLVADPRAELLRLFDYLELPFEESCLRFHENPRAVMTQSSEQVRRPLYRSGMAQWVPYEPWLGPLKAALGPVLDRYPDAPERDDISKAVP